MGTLRVRVAGYAIARTAALAVAVAAGGIGCTTTAPTTTMRPAERGCNETYTEELAYGRIANNAWNKERAETYPSKQCIRVRDAFGVKEYGWSWDWPTESDTLLSFPQVIFGWKPWDGGASSHPELPIRITDIDELRLSYVMETRSSGKHSLATTLWLTRTGAIGSEPNPNDISTDLMIWTDGFSFEPFGERVGHASIDDLHFEVWRAHDLGDTSSEGPRWDYVAYRSTSKRSSASLDLGAFLRHAVEHGFVAPHHYVSDVEVGNEIMSGSGETWIKALSLEVKRSH